MLLFFDTETTGLVRDFAPLEAAPQLVQLACILAADDGTEEASFSTIISPAGAFTIPDQVAHIHGINNDKAETCGISLQGAVRIFCEFQGLAQTQIAHNHKFDDVIIRAAIMRSWPKLHAAREAEKFAPHALCTMELASPILAIPPTPAMVRAGRHGHKSPRLSEAYQFFFNEPLVGAHDALVDVRACARVYFHMRDKGMLS